MSVRLIWDFFGTDARGTASHHNIHLQEFFTREGVGALELGVGSAGEGHAMSWCEVECSLEEMVSRALKPQRRVGAANFDKVQWR